MININALTSAATTNQSSSTGKTEKKSDRDMFMTLLVTQLKNQDPLEPQDGAAFVAQLAQFNSLDQLVGIRQSIEQLTALLQQQKDAPKSDSNAASDSVAAIVSQLENFASIKSA